MHGNDKHKVARRKRRKKRKTWRIKVSHANAKKRPQIKLATSIFKWPYLIRPAHAFELEGCMIDEDNDFPAVSHLLHGITIVEFSIICLFSFHIKSTATTFSCVRGCLNPTCRKNLSTAVQNVTNFRVGFEKKVVWG